MTGEFDRIVITNHKTRDRLAKVDMIAEDRVVMRILTKTPRKFVETFTPNTLVVDYRSCQENA